MFRIIFQKTLQLKSHDDNYDWNMIEIVIQHDWNISQES